MTVVQEFLNMKGQDPEWMTMFCSAERPPPEYSVGCERGKS